MRGWLVIFVVLGLVLLALLPSYFEEYFVNLASQILIAIIFASSLNLLVGYAGLTSLGHACFLGLSAYTSAWLGINLGLGHAITAPSALILTTVVGMLFGAIALRASGLGFLMLTLALSQIVWGLAYRWVSITNGDNGISGLTRPSPFGIDLEVSSHFYWFTLIIALVCLFLISQLVHSVFGSTIKGTRDQPRRMTALGYNIWAIRWFTYVTASFFGAVAGLLYVYFHKFIHPSVMAITVSAESLLSVIAGGSGTLMGPVVGAVVVVILKNYASAYVERWNMLIGFVFLFIVMFMPKGVVSSRLSFLSTKSDKDK